MYQGRSGISEIPARLPRQIWIGKAILNFLPGAGWYQLSWKGIVKRSEGTHAVVLGVMLQLGQPQHFHQRWNIHGESSTQTFF